jgi:hypothetical protein
MSENVSVLGYADDLKLFIDHKMHWGLYAVSIIPQMFFFFNLDNQIKYLTLH